MRPSRAFWLLLVGLVLVVGCAADDEAFENAQYDTASIDPVLMMESAPVDAAFELSDGEYAEEEGDGDGSTQPVMLKMAATLLNRGGGPTPDIAFATASAPEDDAFTYEEEGSADFSVASVNGDYPPEEEFGGPADFQIMQASDEPGFDPSYDPSAPDEVVEFPPESAYQEVSQDAAAPQQPPANAPSPSPSSPTPKRPIAMPGSSVRPPRMEQSGQTTATSSSPGSDQQFPAVFDDSNENLQGFQPSQAGGSSSSSQPTVPNPPPSPAAATATGSGGGIQVPTSVLQDPKSISSNNPTTTTSSSSSADTAAPTTPGPSPAAATATSSTPKPSPKSGKGSKKPQDSSSSSSPSTTTTTSSSGDVSLPADAAAQQPVDAPVASSTTTNAKPPAQGNDWNMVPIDNEEGKTPAAPAAASPKVATTTAAPAANAEEVQAAGTTSVTISPAARIAVGSNTAAGSSQQGSQGVSPGAAAGIAIGSFVGALLLVAGGVLAFKKVKAKKAGGPARGSSSGGYTPKDVEKANVNKPSFRDSRPRE